MANLRSLLTKPTYLFFVVALLTGCQSATADPDTEWLNRSTAPGVFYKNNFNFSNTQALVNSSYRGFPAAERAVLETVNKLSGSGAFKALILRTSNETTPDYRHSFDMPVGSQTKNVNKKAFYYQFAIYLPSYILSHRFKTVNGISDTRHKFAIIQEPDLSFRLGEVVITNARFRGFVTAYRMRDNGTTNDFTTAVLGSPCRGGNPNYQWQNAIDAGPQSNGAQTDDTSCALFKNRYGPIQYDFTSATLYGTALNIDTDAAKNGVTWVADAWNVVETYINYDTQTFKLWHAVYGQAPKLVLNFVGNAELGNRAGNYTGVQLLPRLEQLAPDLTRQNTYAIYDEIIASDQFIAFPKSQYHPPQEDSGTSTPSTPVTDSNSNSQPDPSTTVTSSNSTQTTWMQSVATTGSNTVVTTTNTAPQPTPQVIQDMITAILNTNNTTPVNEQPDPTPLAIEHTTPSVTLGPAPLWAKNMSPGTWKAISLNYIADMDPEKDPLANPSYPKMAPWAGNTGQQSVVLAWNGGAFATHFGTKGALIAWGGGHHDYYGNEIYAFDMAQQRWLRLTNPYPYVRFPVPDGIFEDGTPSPPHTYGFAGYHPLTNSFVTMRTQIDNASINATQPMFFSFDTQRWRRGVQYIGATTGGWMVYDESRDAWWLEGGNTGSVFARYNMNGDGTAGTWTHYPPKLTMLGIRGARDPIHDIIVVTTFRKDSNIYAYDLKNPAANKVLLQQGGELPPVAGTQGAQGWEWSPALKGFIYWRNGGDVYMLQPPVHDWRTATWIWHKLTASNNTIAPIGTKTGIYNRFRIVDYSDIEIAVVINAVQDHVYAFRMP